MQVYNLFDLNEYIRRVLTLNFRQPLWIAAEIAQVGQSRGHFYLDLVQKGETDDVVAQAQAILWAGDYRRLRVALGLQLDAVLREGLAVKMQVQVDFHERYGLKFVIADFDPAYTFGQIELQRRQIIQTLREQGLTGRNAALPLPPVLQRIAVISSEEAAGRQDFQEHLAKNAFGYRFCCRFFEASVQGKNAEKELTEALKRVALQYRQFDCAVVVRGGGARLDLSAFDGLDLCQTAARMPIPLFTGIGHDSDETVLDLMAHTSLKTPTAVAGFILQHNLFFETGLMQLADATRAKGEYLLKINQLELQRVEAAVGWSSRERLRAAAQALAGHGEQIPRAITRLINNHNAQISQMEAICTAVHPDSILRRGYSMTLKGGRPLVSASGVSAGDWLETRLRDGVVWSKVAADVP